MKNKLLLFLLVSFFTFSGYSQTYTSIPDSNFESALVNLGYDTTPNDGQVLTAEIETIIDLDISNENISDVTGIAAFRDLQTLNISDNSIMNLDLTGISNLMMLEANNSGLFSLDVSTHLNLNQLQLDDNNLNALDVTNNTNLTILSVQQNPLMTIDLSNNTQLQTINITNCNIETLTLPNTSTLSQLFLSDNMLTGLDVSSLINLTTLEVENNMLNILNLKNGNNGAITNLNAENNPELFCIIVDDVAFAQSNFTNVGPSPYFTETSCYTTIPDANFEAALSSYDDIPNDGQVPTGNIYQIDNLSITNAGIQDLTGIEVCTSLMNLDISGNALTTVDLTSNTLLQNLEAQNNNIQTIDITGLPNLSQLDLSNNAITSLDLSTLTSVNFIDLSSNTLESLNIQNGNNFGISQLDVRSNPNLECIQIDDLNLLNIPNIFYDSQTNFTTETYCIYTAIPDANFEARLHTLGYDDVLGDGQVPTALIEVITTLDLMDASISDLTGIADFESLTNLQLDGNTFNTLDLSTNAQLQVLQAIDCNIQNINISGLTNLTQVILQFNALTSLDLSTNTALSSINLSSNNLSYLSLQNGNNASITLLNVRSNPNLECVLLDDLNVLTNATVLNNPQTNFTTTQYCEYISIPDSNFEAALEALGYDDISADGQVPRALIENVTTLNVSNSTIADLTGIEDFIALTNLDASGNNLTNVSLTTLVNLEILELDDNPLLTSLNVSGNTQLKELNVEDCDILSALDVSTNVLLEQLFANQTNLSSVTFGNLTNLTRIDFSGSNLVTLDVSSLTALTNLDVRDNQLLSLNIANGNNTNFTLFEARNNANLNCIAVDDPVYAAANFTNIDAQTSFRETTCYTAIPDANFEEALRLLDYDDIPGDGQVPTYVIEVITDLDVRESNISDLTGIEDFTALQNLNLKDNNISSVDLSNNSALISFRAEDNRLDSLDLSNNPLLEDLRVPENNLSSIDLSNQPNLRILQINKNDLTSIDLSTNPLLSRCQLSENNLTSLDLSTNTTLSELFVRINNLEYLNVRNGNNTNISIFRTFDNPNLTCILVDDAAYSTTNWTSIDIFTSFTATDYCGYTTIPDASFEAALDALGYDDIAGDGQVPTEFIEGITSLNVESSAIADLTGIEDFVALETLNYDSNAVATIDLSNNAALKTLYARSNGINSIDLSANLNLERVFLTFNNLTSVDVSTNTNLIALWVQDNQITSVDVSNNTALEILGVSNNLVTSLDVSNNPSLDRLFAANNNLTALDLSANPNLTVIALAANELTALDVRNGNNTIVTQFSTLFNPLLTCISVDDTAYSATNWTDIDAQTNFAEAQYCAYTAIPDSSFESTLAYLGYDDIAGDGQVPTVLIEGVTTLSMINMDITDLTGIQDFTALEALNVNGNALNTLDLSANTNLITVECTSNGIDSVNLNGLTALQEFDGGNNSYTILDVSTNTNLIKLHCQNTDITQLDVSPNTALTDLDCSINDLTALNVRNGNNTNFTNLNATNNPNLTCIFVDDAAYSTTNWTNIDATASFTATNYCRYTLIPDSNFEAALEALGYDDISSDGQVPTALIETVQTLNILNNNITDFTGIEAFTSLEVLDAKNNLMSSIDLTNLVLLKDLELTNCPLTNLDLSANVLLERLDLEAAGNFNTLDVSNNTLLEEIDATDIGFTNFIFTSLDNIRILALSDNALTSLDFSTTPMGSLEILALQNNNLDALNLQNGTNTNIQFIFLTGNPNLNCVIVDDATYSTTNWTNIDVQTSFSDTYCRYTAIPDANFEAALDALGYDDISGDGQVPTALIETVQTLTVSDSNIADATGIEDFTLLESLDIRNNSLATLNVSQNAALRSVNAVSNNLITLDITNNPLVDDVRVEFNGITSIDLSNQSNLRILQINNNQLTAIDVSNNPLISRLRLSDNSITSLDLSFNISLHEVLLNGNELEYLNIQNGSNTDITDFRAFGNPNLTCILVDDAAYSTTNWTNIDATTSFSDTYCRYTTIPDANFEAALENLGYDDISGDGQVPTVLIENVTSLDIQGQSISDITGIEDFIAVRTLRCTNNSISTLDLSVLTNLKFLWCNQNQLTALDLSNNTALNFVSASENSISNFNGTGLNNLEVLYLWSNQLSSIDVSDMTALIDLDVFGNLLTSIDVSNNIGLQEINLRNNSLTTLDLSTNTTLYEVDVRNNDLMSLNIKNGNNTSITSFAATSNPNLTCVLVDDVVYSTTNWTTIDVQTSFSDTTCTTDYSVAIKIYLQGATLNPNTGEETLMRDDLRVASLLPTTSPYADGITCEATVFSTTGNDAIVDWVWVELRNQTDNTQVLYSQSALVQRDGDVVAVDGTSSLNFNTTEDTFYIAIHHRNHLGIISDAAITLTPDVDSVIDFTNSSVSTYGSNAQTNSGMPSGMVGMWSGNVNGDTVVQYSGTDPDTPDLLATVLNDSRNFLNFPTFSITEYNVNDVNMDGTIQYSGTNPDTPFILQNVLAHPGNFLNFSTYQIIEQLPENTSAQ